TRVFAFLGAISFSLYLVHVPVLIFASYALRALPQPVVLLVAVPCAFGIAIAFHRFVERPSHVWSRAVGDWASRVFARSTTTITTSGPAAGMVPGPDATTDRSELSAGRAAPGPSASVPVA
ncbi:MAG: hypothetical protein ABWX82_09370, partial [Leifsonia sp.]